MKVALWWGVLLLWCGVIFWATGDAHFTGAHTQELVAQTAPTVGIESAAQVDWLNMGIRKVTHVVMFAGVGMLAWQSIRSWPAPRRSPGWAWLFATLYAASDELHQHFVPGRTASVWDVLLDSTAAALILLVLPYMAQQLRARRPTARQ